MLPRMTSFRPCTIGRPGLAIDGCFFASNLFSYFRVFSPPIEAKAEAAWGREMSFFCISFFAEKITIDVEFRRRSLRSSSSFSSFTSLSLSLSCSPHQS